MEIIRGKCTSFMDRSTLAQRLSGYETLHIDIGTGDGRFVQHLAQAQSKSFVIGIDACRENLQEASRRSPENALFVIANAQTLPCELDGLAASVTINFPWGSLIESLLANDTALMAGLLAISRADATLEVYLNGGALREAGWELNEGTRQVRDVLRLNGFSVAKQISLAAGDLKTLPTTWAKRLAFGRDPRAMYLRAVKASVRELRSA